MDEPWKDFQQEDTNTSPWEDFGGATAVAEPAVPSVPAPTGVVGGFERGANLAAGGLLKGAAEALEPVGQIGEILGTAAGGGAPAPRTAAGTVKSIQDSPLYRSGQFISQTGAEIPPPTGIPGKASELAAAFLPAVLSGPVAPAVIGLQTAGDTIGEQYTKAKSDGLSDEDAAVKALRSSQVTGVSQALIWRYLPKPLQSVIARVTGKIGAAGIAGFLARRAAGAVEGATLGAASTAAQNVTTGKPISENVLPSAVGLGAVQAITSLFGGRGRVSDNVLRGTSEQATIPPGLEEAAKVLPRATAAVAQIQPTTEGSDATQEWKVEGNVPRERPRDDQGGTPAEPSVGGGVPAAGGEAPPTGAPSASVRPAAAEVLTPAVRQDGKGYEAQLGH